MYDVCYLTMIIQYLGVVVDPTYHGSHTTHHFLFFKAFGMQSVSNKVPDFLELEENQKTINTQRLWEFDINKNLFFYSIKSYSQLWICLMSVTLDTSHLEISPLKDVVSRNIRLMLVIFVTSHSLIGPLNFPSENMSVILTTCDTSHLAISPSNRFAFENIPSMSVTLDTSHLETSLLKFVLAKMFVMSVTLDTSHFKILVSNNVA